MTRLIVRDLAAGTPYFVQVREVTQDSQSDWSYRLSLTTSLDTSIPNAPTDLSWTSAGRSFIGTWTAPTHTTDGQPLYNFDRYEVRITHVSSGQSVIYSTKSTRFDFTYEMNEAKFGTAKSPLNFEVRAVTSMNNASAWAGPITGTNPVPGPVVLTVVESIEENVLTWEPPNDLDLVGYNIYAANTASAGTKIGFSNSLDFAHNTTTGPWYYNVRAVDIFGQESPYTISAGYTPKIAVLIDTTAPNPATGVSVVPGYDVARQQAYITVTWIASSTPADVRNYIIRFAPTAASNYDYVTVNNDVSSTRIDVSPGINYYVDVQAIDFVGNKSTWASPIPQPTAVPADTTAPTSVPTLTLSGAVKSLMAQWTEATENDVKNGAGMYEVQVDTVNTFNSGNLKTSKVSTLMTTFANLVSNTIYYGRVRAIDSSGNAGPYSSIASTTIGQATSADIAVGSIYTDRLVVGSLGDNVIPNGGFDEQATISPWIGSPGAWSIDTTNTNGSLQAIKDVYTTPAALDTVTSAVVPVVPGEKYSLGFSYKATATSQILYAGVSFFNTPAFIWSSPGAVNLWTQPSTKLMTSTVTALSTATAYADRESVFTVPAGMTWMRLTFIPYSSVTMNFWLDNVRVRKMVGNAQIIDASIDTAQIIDLAVTNAKIQDLQAQKITAGTGLIVDLTIGNATQTGSIRSYDYVSGTTGFKIGTIAGVNTLEINSGTIKASTLELKNSFNKMPWGYSSFEARPASYQVGGAYEIYKFGATTTLDASVPIGGQGQSLKVTSTSTNSQINLTKGLTVYNTPVEALQTYIVSYYAKSASGTPAITPWFKFDSGSSISVGVANLTTSWQRFSGTVVAPAGATGGFLYFETPSNGTIYYLDSIQIEEKVGKLNTPSPYNPPSMTTIDGGVISTGSIQSNQNITVNGVVVPRWYINIEGAAQFSDAKIIGTLVVGGANIAGTGTDTSSASLIRSQNFSTGVSGWRIDASGNAEFNSAVIRGQLSTGTIIGDLVMSGGSIKTGTDPDRIEINNSGIFAKTDDPILKKILIAGNVVGKVRRDALDNTYILSQWGSYFDGTQTALLRKFDANGNLTLSFEMIPVYQFGDYDISPDGTKLYIHEQLLSDKIRKFDLTTQTEITTGGFPITASSEYCLLRVDNNENIIFYDRTLPTSNYRIRKYNSSGTQITTGGFPIVSPVTTVSDMAIDNSGNIYLLHNDSTQIVRYSNTGVSQATWTISSGYKLDSGMSFFPSGSDFILVDDSNPQLRKFNGSGVEYVDSNWPVTIPVSTVSPGYPWSISANTTSFILQYADTVGQYNYPGTQIDAISLEVDTGILSSVNAIISGTLNAGYLETPTIMSHDGRLNIIGSYIDSDLNNMSIGNFNNLNIGTGESGRVYNITIGNNPHMLVGSSPTKLTIEAVGTWYEQLHPVYAISRNTSSNYTSGSEGAVTGFNSTTYNDDNTWGYTGGVFTCKIPGMYNIIATAGWTGNASGIRQTSLWRNGSRIIFSAGQGSSGGLNAFQVMTYQRFAEGDTLELRVIQTSGATLALNSADMRIMLMGA